MTATNDKGIYPLSAVGERFPVNDASKPPKLPDAADRETVLHDLLVGVADVERVGFLALKERGATPLQTVRTAGGGAKNPQWRQLRQNMLGVPVLSAPNTDASFGAALLAIRHDPKYHSALKRKRRYTDSINTMFDGRSILSPGM